MNRTHYAFVQVFDSENLKAWTPDTVISTNWVLAIIILNLYRSILSPLLDFLVYSS